MPSINDWASAFVQLDAAGWVQNINTAGASVIKMQGVKANPSAELRVPGLGDILELPFNINLVRGHYEWTIAGMPKDAIGFLAHHETDHQHKAFIGGGFWLSEDIFDDLWIRIRGGPYFDTSLTLKAAPLEPETVDVVVWDRAVSKFLYIAGADFSFAWRQ